MKVVIFIENTPQRLEQRINEYIGEKNIINVSVSPDGLTGNFIGTLLVDT